MAETDLFVRLATYRPSKEKSSIENFLTELVAHLLEQEHVIRHGFVYTILNLQDPSVDRDYHEVHTQVATRSRVDRLKGLRLDLTFGRRESPKLICENKVDSILALDQLQNYLCYADEKAAMVAVVTKQFQPVAAQCRHPRFLGQFYWSDFAETWSRIPGVTNEYLLKGVLELMRRQGMGPQEPIVAGELDAHPRWVALQNKMRRLAEDVQNRLDRDVLGALNGPTDRGVVDVAGHIGLMWCAPPDRSPSSCVFGISSGSCTTPRIGI